MNRGKVRSSLQFKSIGEGRFKRIFSGAAGFLSTDIAIGVYVLVFIAINFAGVSLLSPSVYAPYVEGSSSAPAGSAWIEGNSFSYADGFYEYYFTGTERNLVDGSSSGPNGALWIEGGSIHWIDSSSDEFSYTGYDTGVNPSGPNGAVWMENNLIHYIDANGNERTLEAKWWENFESYSDGTSVSNIAGWSGGADCGTCEADTARGLSGGTSFYANVGSTDDWQDVLIKDFSNRPLTGEVKISYEYWESSSNTDGNLWVRACDGTNIAGIGTENPQFEWVTNSGGGKSSPRPDYQHWTYAEMVIDLNAATADFYWLQDNGGESWDVNGKSIPSGKKICTVGVGPKEVWNVDNIKIVDR